MNQNSSGLAIIALYLFLSVYLFPFFPGSGSEREVVNWASAASLVESTTFDISKVETKISKPSKGKEQIELKSVKRSDGSVYAEAPPGMAVLSAPFYAIARLFLGEAGGNTLTAGWFTLRLILSSLPLLLLAVWLYSSEVDALSLGVLLFATPLFPLSFFLYPYIIVSILVYLAFRVIYDFTDIFPGRCFTSGVYLGLAMSCSLWAALPIVVFGLGLLFTNRRDRWRRIFFYIIGVLPFLAALALYYQLAFGSPLEAVRSITVSVPDLSKVYSQWISPSRGIFAYSPILLFSLTAVFTSREEGTRRFRIKYLTIALAFVLVLFVQTADASPFIPMGVLMVVPLMLDAFFDGETDDYSSLWRGFFFTVSLLMCALPMLTYPFAPADLAFPHNSFWQPLIFVDGGFVPNAAVILGFAYGWVWMAPVFAALTLVLFAVWRAARYPITFAVGILAGVLLIGNYIFFADLEADRAFPAIEKTLDSLGR